jgi:predicted ATPase
MKLKVKNLGPIKQGEIDLSKRFSLFVGYNNSGKTYMSQVIWSLLDFWSETNPPKQLIFSESYSFTFKKNIFDTYLEDLKDPSNTVSFKIEDIKAVYENHYNEIRDKVISNFNINNKISSFDNLEISFPNDIHNFKNQEIIQSIGVGEYFYTFEKLAGSLNLKLIKHFDNNDNVQLPIDYSEEEKVLLQCFLYDFITSIFTIDREKDDKFFLPADRSFYAAYYKFIYASIKEDFEKFKQQRKNKNRDMAIESNYTSSVNDLISNIYDLNLKTRKESIIYQDLIEELQKVIGGDIVTKSSNQDISSLAKFKLKMENQEELDMHLSSSSVNQLTTLYLYLKYWAKESGNTLIIDEPEENLHPRNQIMLLNVLMKFAKRSNNRVIITTHSPLMTDAVNNHLHLGYLSEKYHKDIAALISENNLDLDADAALSHNDIGIYFFDGQSIKEYDVEEYGVDFKDFRKEQENIEEIGDALRGLIMKEKKQQLRERIKTTVEYVQ